MACVTLLECFVFLTLMSLLSTILAVSTTLNMSRPGCLDKCGNITIPFPFGTHPGCYKKLGGFQIRCDESSTPPKAFLGTMVGDIELIDINIINGETRVYTFISFSCYDKSNKVEYNNSGVTMLFLDHPFLLSNRRNKFIVIGCFRMPIMWAYSDRYFTTGCLAFCDDVNNTAIGGDSCTGLGCCQSSIAAGLNRYGIFLTPIDNGTLEMSLPFSLCHYALLAQEDWYKYQVHDLSGFDFFKRNKNGVPIVLDWAIRDNGTCHDSVEKISNPACLSNHSSCHNTSNGQGYLCQCRQGYEGNPYLPGGCVDTDECNSPDIYPCGENAICINTDGNFTCFCPKGRHGTPYGKDGTCIMDPEKFSYHARVVISIVVGVAILPGLCFLAATLLQHKRRIKEKEEYQRYYNMMENNLRVFSKKQLEIATDSFAESHVLGAGGQGMVYKGLLEDNQTVAIKKVKEVEKTQREEFVNEILLLSQINHKNIVRLLGCCLEVKIPMLVYEFVPNGTLFELLHGKSKNMPISLGIRLRVALESADTLDYLHSSISQSILHGDIKWANILLEDEYHAKVSDFGASNLVPIDDTEVVKVVQGTRGYLDPEYVATAVLTKKSDVYSFGVVLLELITRKYAIYTDETSERKHLASCFVSNVSKNKLHELLDKEIVTNNEKIIAILHEVSDLAVWCLKVRGEDRPTMRQVVEKLQHLERNCPRRGRDL